MLKDKLLFAASAGIPIGPGLFVWGANTNGRTGFGVATGNVLVPTRVSTARSWIMASAGGLHTVAINSVQED